MPLVSEYLASDHDFPAPDDEFNESKPELWPLFLPSQLSEDDRSQSHKGVTETELALRLAQVQDNLIDLRRLRRSLRSVRTYFRSNIVGEGVKAQTKSRVAESGVVCRINRTVQRYRLAYAALLSLDPRGDWTKEYFELTDKDNRGPGKEQDEKGVGDGRYTMSWIWRGYAGAQEGAEPPEHEVNETVRHEWMTCRARADRWKEESELLQEEMRRIIAFLEWKSTWWGSKAGSRSGHISADIQHGVDSYARRQASTYHELAVSLAKQWIPHLTSLGLDVSWTKSYPWASAIGSVEKQPLRSSKPDEVKSSGVAPSSVATFHNLQKDGATNSASFKNRDDIEDEGDDILDLDGRHDGWDEGESSEGFGMGFEYDDNYMTL